MLRRILLLLSFAALAVPSVQAHAQARALAYAVLSGAAVIRLVGGGCCAKADVGSTVRMPDARSTGGTVTGSVIAVDADSFTVEMGITRWRGATAGSYGMQVKTRESKWAQGWLTGLFIGGGAGAFLGLISSGDDAGWFSGGEMVLVGTVAGGAVGSVAGALIGMLVEGDRWQTHRGFVQSATVQPFFSRKGAGVGVRLRF